MKIKQTVVQTIDQLDSVEFTVMDILRKILEVGPSQVNYHSIKRALWQISHAGHVDYLDEGRWVIHRGSGDWLNKPWRTTDNRTLFGDEYESIMGVAA